MVHEDARTIPTPETDLDPDTPDPSFPLATTTTTTTFYYNEHGEPVYTTGSPAPFPPVIWPDPSGALPPDLFLGLDDLDTTLPMDLPLDMDLDLSMPLLPMALPMMNFSAPGSTSSAAAAAAGAGADFFPPYVTPPPSTVPPSEAHYLGSTFPLTTPVPPLPQTETTGMHWDLDPLAAWPAAPPLPDISGSGGGESSRPHPPPVKARKWMTQMNSLPDPSNEGLMMPEQGFGGGSSRGNCGEPSAAAAAGGNSSQGAAAAGPQGRAGRKKKAAKKDELMPYRGIVRGFQTLWQRDKGK